MPYKKPTNEQTYQKLLPALMWAALGGLDSKDVVEPLTDMYGAPLVQKLRELVEENTHMLAFKLDHLSIPPPVGLRILSYSDGRVYQIVDSQKKIVLAEINPDNVDDGEDNEIPFGDSLHMVFACNFLTDMIIPLDVKTYFTRQWFARVNKKHNLQQKQLVLEIESADKNLEDELNYDDTTKE